MFVGGVRCVGRAGRRRAGPGPEMPNPDCWSWRSAEPPWGRGSTRIRSSGPGRRPAGRGDRRSFGGRRIRMPRSLLRRPLSDSGSRPGARPVLNQVAGDVRWSGLRLPAGLASCCSRPTNRVEHHAGQDELTQAEVLQLVCACRRQRCDGRLASAGPQPQLHLGRPVIAYAVLESSLADACRSFERERARGIRWIGSAWRRRSPRISWWRPR